MKAQVCQWGEQTRDLRLAGKYRILKWKKNEHIFRWRSTSSRDSVHCTQGPWDKQCVAHSFALCCSVLHAPISVSMLQANDVPAVR